jgi:hypothetical protein
MASLDYGRRLLNLQKRRFDGTLNESLLSKSFSDTGLPEDLRYLAESMKPIPTKSTNLTIEAARRVQNHLEKGFDLPFSRAYRTQGSVMSNTHIKASDFDFLTIIDRYHYTAPDVPVVNPYKGDPIDDLSQLRKQVVKIMRATYDEVDDSHDKCISIFNKGLRRKVDIVLAYWYNTKKYNETEDEYYRGVKFNAKQKQADFPFAHIYNVNNKGDSTRDGSRMAIRLLKTLREDSEKPLEELKSFHLTAIIHSMNDGELSFVNGNEVDIASAVSDRMQNIIRDPALRTSIVSPNSMELPLRDNDLLPDIVRLKSDLDALITDVSTDLLKSSYSRRAILNY